MADERKFADAESLRPADVAVVEDVPGGSLEALLEKDPVAAERESIEPRAASALVHGELGPDHVLLDRRGAPVLIDIEGAKYFDVETVLTLWLLDPASGSVSANAMRRVPSARPGSQAAFISGDACAARIEPQMAGEITAISSWQAVRRELFCDDDQLAQPGAAAVVVGGQVHAQQPGLTQVMPQLGDVAPRCGPVRHSRRGRSEPRWPGRWHCGRRAGSAG